ncbi:MAG: ABC-F family ATP-binding cassette domain-containing protein [Epsilonproteobacteria bacterium]|nr:ABC transporter ATP-binding protein [Campylobacterota bacterium]NPA57504.1 ABC-F family ATP-binding cassette domain-containing protein [Campylobacterota bacterium]
MALVDLEGVEKRYHAQKILCGIDLHIEEGERIALVGRNGSGKSTLMRIVAGVENPDSGERRVRQGLRVKMLPQKPSFSPNLTVAEAIEAELSHIREKRKEYEEISLQLSQDHGNSGLLHRLDELAHFLDYHGAWNLEEQVDRILHEFQLEGYRDRLVVTLSGGEQRRVALAGLLLHRPDLLLLDEPTNHLDLQMVSFLEELLLKSASTLLFVSHDRSFIDRIATSVVELEECQIRRFRGGYRDYLQQKEELLQNLQKEHENLLRLLKQEEEWLRRGVRARVKRNEGRKKRLLELREQAKRNPAVIRKMKLQLEREKHHFNREEGISRKKVLFEIENLTKSLGGKLLIENFSTRILQRDRIAIVGRNGSGKSTFLKLLLGEMEPDSGVIKRGEFTIGYFDQHRSILDDRKDLIETFCPNGGDRIEVEGRSIHVYGYLKNFLFPKEDLNKKIGALSGGEKSRVALALLLTKKVDCLILDEPTNDLDIPTITILEEYLQRFRGALIFVSHDRYFVDKIANKLLIFRGDGRIEESHQSFTDYLQIEEELRELEKMEREVREKGERKSTPPRKRRERLSYKEERRLEELPGLIEELEQEIERLTRCLADPDCYGKEGILPLSSALADREKERDRLLEEYIELEEKRERIENGS